MPFISKGRLQDLEIIEKQMQDFDEKEAAEERKYYRDLAKARKSIQRSCDNRIEDLTDEYRDDLKEIRKDHQSEIDEVTAELDKANRELGIVTTERDALRKSVKEYGNLVERELELNAREREMDSRDTVLNDREASVSEAESRFARATEAHAKEVAAARKEGEEIGEKRGYANGISDGVREISKQTEASQQTVVDLANKAQDALISASTREIPAPVINTLPVAVPTPAPAQNKSK